MADDHFASVSPDALYKHREDALKAPGQIYTHFKGGIYRKLGRVKYQAGDFVPEQGDTLVIYEHIFPHEHSLFARTDKDFRQIVQKDEYAYEGHRFEHVPGTGVLSNIVDAELKCQCSAYGHRFHFEFDDADIEYPYVSVETHLECLSGFWGRVADAFRYVFGQKKFMGNFIGVHLDEKELVKLQKFVNTAVDKIQKRL